MGEFVCGTHRRLYLKETDVNNEANPNYTQSQVLQVVRKDLKTQKYCKKYLNIFLHLASGEKLM